MERRAEASIDADDTASIDPPGVLAVDEISMGRVRLARTGTREARRDGQRRVPTRMRLRDGANRDEAEYWSMT